MQAGKVTCESAMKQLYSWVFKKIWIWFYYLLLELLRVVWVHQKVAWPVLCKEHQLLHHCWYPNWEQHQLKWKYLNLVEVLQQFRCIKESSYYSPCNGMLDSTVHDLVLLSVANTKKGRMLQTRCHTGTMMMQLLMVMMMIKKERERNNNSNFHIYAWVDQSCTARKTLYRLPFLTCLTLAIHHSVPIEFFCGRQF